MLRENANLTDFSFHRISALPADIGKGNVRARDARNEGLLESFRTGWYFPRREPALALGIELMGAVNKKPTESVVRRLICDCSMQQLAHKPRHSGCDILLIKPSS